MTAVDDDAEFAALDALITRFGSNELINNKTQEPEKPEPESNIKIYARESPTRKFSRVNDGDVQSPNIAQKLSGSGVSGSDLCRNSNTLTVLRREMIWHLAHGERVDPAICAGCRRPIRSGEEAWHLADDNVVHITDDYACLIAWGERWREAARQAVITAATVTKTADEKRSTPDGAPPSAAASGPVLA